MIIFESPVRQSMRPAGEADEKLPYIIHVSGYPGSGKTTLGAEIQRARPDFSVVDTDDLLVDGMPQVAELVELKQGDDATLFNLRWREIFSAQIHKAAINAAKAGHSVLVFVGILDHWGAGQSATPIAVDGFDSRMYLDVPVHQHLRQFYTRICKQFTSDSDWSDVASGRYPIPSSESVIVGEQQSRRWHTAHGYEVFPRDVIYSKIVGFGKASTAVCAAIGPVPLADSDPKQMLAGGSEGIVVTPVRAVDGDTLVVQVVSVPSDGYDTSNTWTVRRRGRDVEGRFARRPDRITLTVAPVSFMPTKHVIQRGAELRLRLGGIDAPETRQAYGPEARVVLDELVHRSATLFLWVSDVDKYGRLVAHLSSSAVRDVNAAMVQAGAAWVYARYAAVPDEYHTYQRAAQVSRLGLWQVLPAVWNASTDALPAGLQAPWDWRSERKMKHKNKQ